nr:CHAD domain-containing protein [Tahibacter harae]
MDIIEQQLRRRTHRHGAIHETRKAARRFRAGLELCAALNDDAVAAAGRRVRRIGRKLSPLRDAHVAAETAAAQRKGPLAARWRELQQALRRRRDTLLHQALQADPAFRRLRRQAQRVRTELDALDFAPLEPKQLLQALRDSAARLQRAQRAAQAASATVEQRHRWRRRLRRLRQQLDCLQQITADEQAPAAARQDATLILTQAAEFLPAAERLNALTDELGGQQDSANLRRLLRREPALPHGDELCRSLPRKHPLPQAVLPHTAGRRPKSPPRAPALPSG